MVSRPAQPFDVIAPEYDARFTERLLGQWLRSMVWDRLAGTFASGEHVLELGCGTGEDAVWLAERGITVTATDPSNAMLAETRRKAEHHDAQDRVSVQQLDLQSLHLLDGPFDGAFTNFGPINCVEDRLIVAEGLARLVRPGGRVVIVAMGPLCPWEIIWHLAHAEVSTAFRRFRAGVTAHAGGGETMQVWYPSHRRLRREFSRYFRHLETAGVGLLLPPSAMAGLVDRAPRVFQSLATIDRRLASTLLWRWCNDHYLMILERR